VNAVEVADQARREWEREGRPLSTTGSMGQLVEHPMVRTMERLDRAAATFGASLGLDPMSEKRMTGAGVVGKPPGSNSADDRVALPPLKLKRVK
jgi:phage terminase small subunit